MQHTFNHFPGTIIRSFALPMRRKHLKRLPQNLHCYRLIAINRLQNNTLSKGRLFQQWAVDMYIKIESMRLDWYSNPANQKLIRAELYQVREMLSIQIFIPVHYIYIFIIIYIVYMFIQLNNRSNCVYCTTSCRALLM